MGGVPFNVPLRNRNVAGDFHRPYETQNILPPKNFRFLPGERYRVGQGTHVWEPSQSVIKKEEMQL